MLPPLCCFLPNRHLTVKRPIGFAGAYICALQILCSEASPAVGTENPFPRNIVHRNRYSQHTCQRNQITAYMPAAERPVIGSPVCHDGIYIVEYIFPCQVGDKPGGRPCGIGTGIQYLMYSFRQPERIPFCNLQGGAYSPDQIKPY